MSIDKMRTFMEEGPGCRFALAVMFGAIMAAFVIPNAGCPGLGSGDPGKKDLGDAIVSVGGFPVTSTQFEGFYQSSLQRYREQGIMVIPASLAANTYGNAVEQMITGTLLFKLAQDEGIKLDVESLISDNVNQSLSAFAQQKEMWIKDKKLKANATDKEFQALYKKEYGQTTEEVLKNNEEALRRTYDQPEGVSTRMFQANTALLAHYAKQVPATDADVKSSFNYYVGKRIVLESGKNIGVDLAAKLKGIKADIEAKKLTFEDAMDRYSNEVAPKGKRVHENSMEIDAISASVDKNYEPIKNLKPGQMAILSFQNTTELYRFDMLRNDAPPDFATKKEQLRKDYVDKRSVGLMQAGLDKLKARNDLLQWGSKGFQAMYELYRFQVDPATFSKPPAEKLAKYKSFYEAANKTILAADKDLVGTRPAVVARYTALEQIHNATPAADQKALFNQRVEAIGALADQESDPDLMLEVATLVATGGEKATASEWVTKALNAVGGMYDSNGLRIVAEITRRIDALEKDKVLPTEEAKTLRQQLAAWRTAKIDNDKFLAKEAADRKKAEEAQKKADAEEKKRADAEIKRLDAEAKKAAASKTPPKKTGGG